MIRFDSDYMAGAHPRLLDKLVATNLESTPGYGCDSYTAEAVELIKKACDAPQAQVKFLVGGTQTNTTIIDGLLDRHEGVLAAESGHINVHEAGAIEASGHKVLTLPHHDGKVSAEDVERYITDFYADETYQHMVAPGMVYISHPTEYGTIYSLAELEMLSMVCRKANIPLYIDGARLAYGLAASNTDVTLKDIARLADVFYIGGTKAGALFGEAVVVTNPKLLPNIFPLIKLHGALLAKGRLLGIQFCELFQDNLYMEIGTHAVQQAERIKLAFKAKGYDAMVDSPTNQQFFCLPNDEIDRLRANDISFELWGAKGESHSNVRFVTSWSTKDSDVEELLRIIGN